MTEWTQTLTGVLAASEVRGDNMASFDFIGEIEEDEAQPNPFGTVSTAPPPANTHVPDGEIEDLMSEAEKRFSKAKYYETLIKEPIFENDASDTAMEVAKEIQAFSRERLSVLLGIKAARVESDTSVFTKEEIQVLKQVAAKLLKKPELGGLSQTNPTLKKVAVQQKAAPKVTLQEKPTKQPALKQTKKPTETGELLQIPQADGTFRSYKKIFDGDREVYLGENGQKYELMTKETGEHYMKSLSRQAVSKTAKPVPPLSGDALASVASRHAEYAVRSNEIATKIANKS